MLDLTEETKKMALEHFKINALPIQYNGKYEFTDCIILVQKQSTIVYMAGKYDKNRPDKAIAIEDFSKGTGGIIKKYIAIYPIIKGKKEEPVKLMDEKIKNTF
jgi:hypothetical protein